MVEVKRLVTAIIVTIVLIALVILGLGDRDASVAHTGIPDNEITGSQTLAGNSSASATSTITGMLTG
jgi:hypothetical protein